MTLLLPVNFEGDDPSLDPGLASSLYDGLTSGSTTELPEPLRAMHCVPWSTEASGVCRINRPTNALARWLGRLMRLPPAAERIPVSLRIERTEGKETWFRQFGSWSLSSFQWERQGLLFERFGPISFALEIHNDDRTISFTQHAAYWCVGPWFVQLPNRMAPLVEATVSCEVRDLLVDVSVSTRWAGMLLHYSATLAEREVR